jgi:indolepyruvate ferredoxin oxidoreductase
VISSLVLAPAEGQVWSNKVGLGKADLYLVLDLIGGVAPQNLDRCDPLRSVAVVNTTVLPTGEMIRDPFVTVSPEVLERTIAQYTRASENVYVEGRRVVEALFGDYMMTNLFMLGVAYQAGRIPLRAESIEWAIRLNGVQVEENLQAFRYGRLLVHAPERVRSLVEPPSLSDEEERIRWERRLGWAGRRAYRTLLERCRDLDGESRRMLAIRVGDLIEYQNVRYAGRYVDFVLRVAARERQVLGRTGPLTHAVIRYLYKLMAYKDEYEVARLYLREEFWEQLRRLFPGARKIRLHLHPPVLRALGLRRKIQVGTWILPVFRLLRALRRLRGTPLDPFGYARVRREERRLIGWYREVVQRAVEYLRPETYGQVLELLQLPDRIRGYEHVKIRNAEAVRAQAQELLRRLVTIPEKAPASVGGEAQGPA